MNSIKTNVGLNICHVGSAVSGARQVSDVQACFRRVGRMRVVAQMWIFCHSIHSRNTVSDLVG